MTDAIEDPRRRKDKRALAISTLLGLAVGAGHGIPKYGVFHISTVAMMGLGMIVVVGIHAAIVALMPARPAE
jgi:hypothetical protein